MWKLFVMALIVFSFEMPNLVVAKTLGNVKDEYIEICWQYNSKYLGMRYKCVTPCGGGAVSSNSLAQERTLGTERMTSSVQVYDKFNKKNYTATVYYLGKAIDSPGGLCGNDPAQKLGIDYLPLRKKYQCWKYDSHCKTELGVLSSSPESKANASDSKVLENHSNGKVCGTAYKCSGCSCQGSLCTCSRCSCGGIAPTNSNKPKITHYGFPKPKPFIIPNTRVIKTPPPLVNKPTRYNPNPHIGKAIMRDNRQGPWQPCPAGSQCSK